MIFMFSSCTEENSEQEDACIATVNGETITEEEYEYFRKKYKSQVLNECLEKFKTEYTEDFWQTEFDGVTPEEILHDRVIKECVMAKIQLMLMKEEGIFEDISFEGLKLKAETFNSENENKEGVVGIKSIQMSQFYSYYLQTGIMELQNIYADGKLKPTDKEIEEKISEMTKELSSYSEQDYESIAKSRLKSEKYEKYINELYEKAEIKEF
ncbi:MAG: hypothetical protein IKL16_01085 [Clostridia bacterium]|nr:hypothetical protein [Clostridia bacterium]